MMGTPFVMVYRVSPLTYAVGRPRVKVPYFAMVNLIAGEEVVPELVQQDFTAENVVTRLNEILADGPARSKMIAGLAEVKARLSGPTEEERHPVDRAAEAVMSRLGSEPLCQNQAKPCPTSIFCVTIFILRIIVLVLRRLLLIPFQPWRRRRVLWLCLAFSFFLMSLPAWAAENMRLRVDDYQIDAELTPHTHKITAQAKVKFTALEDLNIATFELHNALRVTKVIDAAGQAAERRARHPGLDGSGRARHACSQRHFDHA